MEESVGSRFMRADIYQDHVSVSLENGMSKDISSRDFARSLVASLGIEDTTDKELLSVALPPNVYYLKIVGEEIKLACYYPGGSRLLKYYTKEIPIIFPNVVISHSLRMKKSEIQMQGTLYFCTDLTFSQLPQKWPDRVDVQQRMFLLPMSNTYSDGKMCYGHNIMPNQFPEGNLRGLDWYYQYIFETPFNDDLGIRALPSSIEVKSWYEKLRKLLSEDKPFPYELLRGYTPQK